jgi:hypothetical protein
MKITDVRLSILRTGFGVFGRRGASPKGGDQNS